MEAIYAEAFAELERAVHAALELYSNIHRGTGHNSMVSTTLFERARDIVLKYLNLDKNRYEVVFCTPIRLENLKKQLKYEDYYLISSQDIDLPLGVRALVIKRKFLRKCAPFQTGGGMIKYVCAKSVLWAEDPDRFEAGTPNIINVITFAKALQLIMNLGDDIFKEKYDMAVTSFQDLNQNDYLKYSEKNSLFELRKVMIGQNIRVPTEVGENSYINFDNAASTPTFMPIWETVCQTWKQPKHVQLKIVSEVKKICAEFLGAPLDKYDVIFTSNTTEAINFVAQSLAVEYTDGIEPVVSNTLLEHHSNELPWRYISGVSLIRISIDDDGFVDLNELERILRDYNKYHKHGKKRVCIVAVCGASNVLGVFNDLQSISRIVHKYGAYLLVDGAQLVAHRSIKLIDVDIDYFAFSAHKVYAPFGSGALVVRKGLLSLNSNRLSKIKLSGEENVVGIAAMGAALTLLQRIGMDVIEDQEKALTQRALRGLSRIPNIEIFGIQNPDSPRFHTKGGVIVFSLKKVPHNLVAKELAEYGGIGVRNGCFCAHLLIKRIVMIHPIRILGAKLFYMFLPKLTSKTLPGLVRVSFGIENNKKEVDWLIQTLKIIASKPRSRAKRLLAYTHNGTPSLPHTAIQDRIEEFVEASVNRVYT
ncbi:MAG: aminotransferase class V-fold PLP-dependent enzyme [Thermoplasmatales archaeon]|nr:MAG: aminotransferase class V-fold PLP-dependent enzyme [Thermoplasmatales archaeon]